VNLSASHALTYAIPVISYLLGSIPFGLLIVKLTAGRDIREVGSGNIGAANVARNAGRAAGILTLILDAAKGFAAVALASYITHANITWITIAAVCAIVGHVFPVWLKLRGGKGIATALGVFILISWHAIGLALVLWVVVVFFWNYASLGSVAAAAALPIFVYVLYQPGFAPPDIVTFGTAFISGLVLYKHLPNIQRLLAGEEPRIGAPDRD
jgi:acyl phosphate:glycerol-3-phosphate acyltransferase